MSGMRVVRNPDEAEGSGRQSIDTLGPAPAYEAAYLPHPQLVHPVPVPTPPPPTIPVPVPVQEPVAPLQINRRAVESPPANTTSFPISSSPGSSSLSRPESMSTRRASTAMSLSKSLRHQQRSQSPMRMTNLRPPRSWESSPAPHQNSFPDISEHPAQEEYGSYPAQGGSSLSRETTSMWEQNHRLYSTPPQPGGWDDRNSRNGSRAGSMMSASTNSVLLAGALQAEVRSDPSGRSVDENLAKIQVLASMSDKDAERLITAGTVNTLITLLKMRSVTGVGLEAVLMTLGLLACVYLKGSCARFQLTIHQTRHSQCQHDISHQHSHHSHRDFQYIQLG